MIPGTGLGKMHEGGALNSVNIAQKRENAGKTGMPEFFSFL